MKNQWVLYDSYTDYIKANIVLGRLKSEGINCTLLNENIATINPALGNATGGIKLFIYKSDVEKLKSISEKLKDEMLQNATCPNCNNIGISIITKPKFENKIFAILSWIISNYAIAKTCYQCNTCKHNFDKLDI